MYVCLLKKLIFTLYMNNKYNKNEYNTSIINIIKFTL